MRWTRVFERAKFFAAVDGVIKRLEIMPKSWTIRISKESVEKRRL